MNKIQPRISFQPGLNYSYHNIQNHHEPSIETKKLIHYLQSQKDQKIQDKLRQEVFFNRVQKTLSKAKDQKNNTHNGKLNLSSQQNKSGSINKVLFANRRSPLGKKVYFSPKTLKTQQTNHETPSFIQYSNQLPKKDYNQIQKKESHTKKSSNLMDDKFSQSEKLILTSKQIKHCPQFLRSIKTKEIVQVEQQQFKIEDFIIVKTIGQGTFGEVVQAFHKLTGSVYAIKIYQKQIIKRHELEDKFIHDIKVQLKMNHPHIVKLYGFFNDPINFYMIFEFMESGNLSKTIEEKGGKMGEGQIYRKIFEINDALLYLHSKNLIHRDIKPVSVLTCLDVCKLCDTQWLQEDVNLPHHTTLCRQLDYMAPQAFEGKQITHEFDIWGLGMIAYELLSGKKLIQGTTQKMLIRKIISLNKELIQILIPTKCSYDLKKFIISTLEPVPSKRITSKTINQMKLDKERQITSCFMSNRSISFNQKHTQVLQRSIRTIQKSPPKSALIFGIKKQIGNQVSTLL